MILYFLYCYAKTCWDNCVYFYLSKTLTVFLKCSTVNTVHYVSITAVNHLAY